MLWHSSIPCEGPSMADMKLIIKTRFGLEVDRSVA